MKKLLILSCFILASCAKDELTFYRSDIDKSSNKCKEELYLELTFKIDDKNGKVMKILKSAFKNDVVDIEFLEDCKVIDKQNFKCGGEFNAFTKNKDSSWSVVDGNINYEVGATDFISNDSHWLGRCWYKKTFFGKSQITD